MPVPILRVVRDKSRKVGIRFWVFVFNERPRWGQSDSPPLRSFWAQPGKNSLSIPRHKDIVLRGMSECAVIRRNRTHGTYVAMHNFLLMEEQQGICDAGNLQRAFQGTRFMQRTRYSQSVGAASQGMLRDVEGRAYP